MSKVIVITGGSDGLGKATANLLTKDNEVIILAPNEEKTSKVAKELGCDFDICDVTKWDQVESSIQNIIKKHKRLDVLINSAGKWIIGELDDNSPDQIQEAINVNFIGTVFMTKAVIPQMKTQGEGLIININSQGGLYAKASRSVYQSSKWAVTGFTKCLEHDLKPYGIKVIGFYPGKMATNFFDKVGDTGKDMSNGLKPEEAADALKYLISLPSHIEIPEFGIKHIKG